ncbi:MAG: hypothetical protein IJV96_05515 [Clostridia bacterium]|nr:hypothetical protein [Clostridia bacterium]
MPNKWQTNVQSPKKRQKAAFTREKVRGKAEISLLGTSPNYTKVAVLFAHTEENRQRGGFQP